VTDGEVTPVTRAILDRVEHDSIVRLLADMVEIPSPTGHELRLASWLHERITSYGIDSRLQKFGTDQANVVATLRGSGGGRSILLTGHLDTSYSGLEADLDGPGYKNKAVVVDDRWMYGNGVHNMKNALAAYVGILQAIAHADTKLRGDVILAAVAGETERAPVGRFQGPEYEGFGTGMRHALEEGLAADMCILGEPTANTIGLSNLGVNWVRMTTRGTMAHTQHASTAKNAIYAMQAVLAELRSWCEDYRERNQFRGIKPACDVTAIDGGLPWRASRTPISCSAFVCIRTTPAVTTDKVRRELESFALDLRRRDPSLELEIDFYVTHPATEISADEPVVRALHRHHAAVFGSEPEYRPRTAYMDSSPLNLNGIPTVVYGASGRVNDEDGEYGWAPNQGEHTNLEDLRLGTEVVARTVVELCS
jgi:acetylornithine deacetylase